jgi:hypothetical protein
MDFQLAGGAVMPTDNPVVMCSKHAARFRKVNEEVDNDGTQTPVKQYWAAGARWRSPW